MKKLISVLLTCFLYVLSFSQIPNITYSAPIIVDDNYVNVHGATITGNFRATDGAAYAIFVVTSKPIVIDKCILVSKGTDIIHCNGYTSVTITNSSLYGEYSTDGNTIGRAVNDYMPRFFLMEHSHFETCRGINIDHRDDTPLAGPINIGYNTANNMIGIKRDLSGYSDKVQFIQFNTVRYLTNSAVYWNQFTNDPTISSVEDCISIINTSGTATSPLLIHDNFIKGAYPIPVTGAGFTGSGITVEGDGSSMTALQESSFINIYGNQLVSTMNAAMNISNGHDLHFYGNRAVTSALLTDGTQLASAWAGACIYDGNNVGTGLMYNNTIAGNTLGYVRWNDAGNFYPVAGRQDEENVLYGGVRKDNLMPYGGNTYLPQPITLATEANESILWAKKLSDSGINIGVGGSNVIITPPPITIVSSDSITLKIGATRNGTITPLDSTGETAVYTVGSVTYGSSDATIANVTANSSNELAFVVTGVKAGTALVTVSLKDLAGNTIVKIFKVIVPPNIPLATSIKIVFN